MLSTVVEESGRGSRSKFDEGGRVSRNRFISNEEERSRNNSAAAYDHRLSACGDLLVTTIYEGNEAEEMACINMEAKRMVSGK